jgi:hypothetical protein
MREPHPSARTYRVISEALNRILRPVVRMLLRNGVTYQAFAETVKMVYVQVAAEEFRIPGRKQSDSRISVITGLSRKEVKRVAALQPSSEAESYVRYNRASRVIFGWTQDPAYLDAAGAPALLALEGAGPDFIGLVRRYSGDAPPRAVLDELERVGAVERQDDGRLRLMTRAYIPHTDDADKIGVMGIVVGDLLDTVDHNISARPGEAFFQRSVSNPNMPEGALVGFRATSREQAQQLLEALDRWLSEHEMPREGGAGKPRRMGVGIYYFEDR